MLKIGDRAPEFTLPDHTGKDRSLSELLGIGTLVLYFYPADFTPGCTREACDFRDIHGDLVRVGMRVVGISPQGPEQHAKFRDKYNLPFMLLSDTGKSVIKMYQVNGPLGLGVRRATFLIDPSRRIRDVLLADFSIAKHTEFVKKAILIREPATRHNPADPAQ
jgi:thioredoxin-dependent peroxiredoxin